jgi:hypothetical protein
VLALSLTTNLLISHSFITGLKYTTSKYRK